MGSKGLEIKGFQTFGKNNRLMGTLYFLSSEYALENKMQGRVETTELIFALRDKGTAVL